ncbi:MAG TPA: EF-hand domain-containing protein [Gemmataceae bacterium]|nr:EF-hand domain-containing protein [Gemmataceae bacterium]
MPRRWAMLTGLALLAAGCSGGGDQKVPTISPRDAANQALAEYDTNKDGALDAKELEACPAMLGALKRLDKDGDGRVTADEIADRLTFFKEQGALSDVSVELMFDGRPVQGATVTLVPEKFMGSAAKSASAVTDEMGAGYFKTEGSEYVQVPLGYYRVQVSKNTQGRETIPSKYNAQTVLGYEVSPDVEGRGTGNTLRLRLTSR